jgi:radical SAM superfamily enzyme YgiQ (UPF0313 family)
MSNISKKEIAQKTMESLRDEEAKAKKEYAGNRDQILIERFLEEDKDLQKNRNLTFKNPIINWSPTDKFRIAMIVPPAWTVTFPPYGTAKLTALMRMYDYSVKVYDINVESYYWFLENHGQDYWEIGRHFLWSIKEKFENFLLPDLKFILDKTVNDIIDSNVRVVGMSMYYTSIHAATYMAKELRKKNPDICILAGGPEPLTHTNDFKEGGSAYNLFNYVFVGESEENLINVLENLPEEYPMNEIIGSTNSRLNLDEYPFADYSDYDIRNYTDHGVSMETSRGCIAKCSFCAETHFWKFRSLNPVRIVDEIEHYVKTYKVKRFWFVDSLANGNVKNFGDFIEELLKRKLGIRWHVMARCDGRMDLIFIRKAVASGCTALAFGVETGSQKILNDMRKKVEVWEVEQNLRDARQAGLFNHASWMVGFPTEEAVDFFHNMQLLYNVRKWLETISLGHTFTMADHTHIITNYRDYGIVGTGDPYDYSKTFLDHWYSNNFKSTIIQRFVRLKFSYIWLKILREYRSGTIINPQETEDLNKFYTLDFGKNKNVLDYVEQDFYVNFEQFTSESLADNIANEYVGMCYLLYKYFNRLTFTYKCSPELDTSLFGDWLVRNYYADVHFNVNKGGDYTLIIDHKLFHGTNEDYLKEKYIEERERLGDQSFEQRIEKTGNISDWQTTEPIIRETIHPQYRKK